jgi:hypothetical protein
MMRAEGVIRAGRGLVAALVAVVSLVSCPRSPQPVVLQPPEWSLGKIPPAAPVQQAVRMRNPGRREPQFSFDYYYDPGCQGCEIFLARQMIALQQELQIRLRATRKDIRQPEVHREYLRRLGELGVEERAYPAVVFGEVVLQGDEVIAREFKPVLEGELGRTGEASNR